MDHATQRKLTRIGASIPKRLTQNLTKTIVDNSEEELARAALASKDISPRKKAMIKKQLEAGSFRREEVVENQEVIKEIDEYNTREVKRLRDSGELPDPNNDPFVRERNHRIANRGEKPAKYTSFLKTLAVANKLQPLADRIILQEIIEEEKKSLIIMPDKEKKSARFGKIFVVGNKVEHVKAGQTVVFNIYDFDYIEKETERFLIGSEKGVMGILE